MCFIPLPENGLRRMEILDTIPGFFACYWSFIDSEKAYRYTRGHHMIRPSSGRIQFPSKVQPSKKTLNLKQATVTKTV